MLGARARCSASFWRPSRSTPPKSQSRLASRRNLPVHPSQRSPVFAPSASQPCPMRPPAGVAYNAGAIATLMPSTLEYCHSIARPSCWDGAQHNDDSPGEPGSPICSLNMLKGKTEPDVHAAIASMHCLACTTGLSLIYRSRSVYF